MSFLPVSRTRDRASVLAALIAASPLAALSAPPVIDEPVPVNGESFPTHVEPRVPIGKALIFPITASDPENGALKYTVTSDNPKVTVSVRTALPKLKVQVDHAQGAANDPAFSGVLEFALLRDTAPRTVENISGFAQGKYYNFSTEAPPNNRNQIFHRILDLDPNEEPEGSYILQGGDIKGTGTGGPGFNFENEFHPASIFSGRGQLAMANAGFNSANRGTNGSQFFITLGQPRFLDFNHTIFGQLLRGWDLIESMADVARADSGKPTVDVKLTSAVIEQNLSDAILLISATGPVTAKITVKVMDPDGEEATKEFNVTAYKDALNSPPFLRQVPNQFVPTDRILGIPLAALDLESDYSFINHGLLAPTSGRSSGGGSIAYVVGNPGYVGPLNLGIEITQYDMTYRGDIDGVARSEDDKIAISVAVGDKQIDATAQPVTGAPGIPLTGTLLATYIDGDPAAVPADFTAKVIWGDGTYGSLPDSTSSGDARFSCTITRDLSSPFPGAFLIKATESHIYHNPGIYPVTIEMEAAKGQRATLRTVAVINAGTVHALGKTVSVKGKAVTDGLLATFTDTAFTSVASYTARVHWGDGQYSAGTVKRSPKGELQVTGTHTFPTPGEYAVVVELTKAADPNTPVTAWSRVEAVDAKATRVLPPYVTPNLVGQLGDAVNIGNPVKLIKTGNQISAGAQLIVVNAGSKATKAGKLRFYLSEDKVTNLQDVTAPDPNNPGQTILVTKKDLLVKIGKLNEVKLQALPPGSGVRYVFNQTSQGDFRLKFPAGEGGEGLNLLAHFEYSDPMADNLPISKDAVVLLGNPIIVQPTSITVKESGGPDLSKKFTVKLAKQPRANVVIPITLSTTAEAEITISTTTLTFTPDNWNVPVEVTVTAKEDTVANDSKNVLVSLGAASSTDIRYNNQDPADVVVAVQDKTTTP